MADATLPPIPQLPNPLTPMAWLPEQLAEEVTISNYMFIGASAVIVWDIVNGLPSDLSILFKRRITFPTVVYFISRLFTLAISLLTTIYVTAKVGPECDHFERSMNWLYTVSVSASALLFFFRVRAIFERNLYVVGFFAVMWLGVLGGTMTIAFGIKGMPIGTTLYCTTAKIESYVPAATLLPLANDTLVFFAIAFKLTQNSYRDKFKERVGTWINGDYLPAFSRSLLQDGQLYYLSTVLGNILTTIMLYAPVPVAYSAMFAIPNIVLMNCMACRVFRNVALGRLSAHGTHHVSTIPMSVRPPTNPNTYQKSTGMTSTIQFTQNDLNKEYNGIEVTKTVELHDDKYANSNRV